MPIRGFRGKVSRHNHGYQKSERIPHISLNLVGDSGRHWRVALSLGNTRRSVRCLKKGKYESRIQLGGARGKLRTEGARWTEK